MGLLFAPARVMFLGALMMRVKEHSGWTHRLVAVLLALCLGAGCLGLGACSFGEGNDGDAGVGYSRPPSPGPEFMWLETGPGTGYWKYTGEPQPGQVWVPGHRQPDGAWAPGHWRDL